MKLGNIYSIRDWGHAKDYVKMMYKIINYKAADDFVISTEKQYSVKEFINLVCKKLNLSVVWRGKGVNEKAFNKENKVIIEISKKYMRPINTNYIFQDSFKAKKKLRWKPNKDLNLLIDDMIKFEINELNVKNKIL